MNLPNKLTVFRMILVIIMMIVPIVDSLVRNNRRIFKCTSLILDNEYNFYNSINNR